MRAPFTTPKGDLIILDEEDKPQYKKQRLCLTNGYPSFRRNNKIVYLHRAVMQAADDQFVDHADGNLLNCSRSNLRFVTKQQNNMNRAKNKSNKTGVKGVWFRKDIQKYAAAIEMNGKRKHIGVFQTIQAAKEARKAYAVSMFGKYVRNDDP